jgi:hypothetical protein
MANMALDCGPSSERKDLDSGRTDDPWALLSFLWNDADVQFGIDRDREALGDSVRNAVLDSNEYDCQTSFIGVDDISEVTRAIAPRGSRLPAKSGRDCLRGGIRFRGESCLPRIASITMFATLNFVTSSLATPATP